MDKSACLSDGRNEEPMSSSHSSPIQTKEEKRMERILASRIYARKTRQRKIIYLDNLVSSRKHLLKKNERLNSDNKRLKEEIFFLTSQLPKGELSSNLCTPQLSLQEDHRLSIIREKTNLLAHVARIEGHTNAFDRVARMEGNTNVFGIDSGTVGDNHISNANGIHQRQCLSSDGDFLRSFAHPQLPIPDNYTSNPNVFQQYQGSNFDNDIISSRFESFAPLRNPSQIPYHPILTDQYSYNPGWRANDNHN